MNTTSRTRKLTLGALAAIAAAALAVFALLTFNRTVQQAIFDRAAAEFTAVENRAPLADDALRVGICGTSAPLPSKARAKACVAVFAGGEFWVVDSGPESTENLVLSGIPLSEIGGVLVTHFHSDHIGELGELQLQTWAAGRKAPLAVYGGPGVEDLVDGFNLAYRRDQGYRTEHHGDGVMPKATWGLVAHPIELDGPGTPAKDRARTFYDDGGLRITAIEVNHAPIEPAYAYRFDYRGRSVVVTGDMTYHAPFAKWAADVDLMVSEALSRNMTRSLEDAAANSARGSLSTILHDIQDYHISPEEVARLSLEARADHLAFYHLSPAPDGFLPRRLFAGGVNDVRPDDWSIAEDGDLYTLPLGSTAIELGRIER